MKTVTLHLPDLPEIDEHNIDKYLAAKMFEDGRISLGKAAEVAGMTKREFMEILGSFGVSIFNYPADEIYNDLRTLRNYHR
jgi:predicted HTH domain antitoxin